ncbi:hypothetical protein SDC9_121201 [bioreactor metagenome]|uniref:Uncharacterized protein n=1 Tax=bioreactor metagenome TaxID=1076179 RepID=A0A645CB96_9ZZZZ
MDFFAHDVGGKRQQHQQQHHLRGGHVAQAAGDGAARVAEAPAEQRAHGQTTGGHPHEVLRHGRPRQCAGERCSHRKFQRHQTRCVVEQRFAFQHVHGLVGHAQVAGDGRHGHGIGGRDHGGQRKGHGQRHLGNHPIDQVAQAKYRDQHQPEGQQQDRPGEREELALGNAPSVGKQQWRNEQQHEQLRVERDVQTALWPGNDRAEGDLYEWQGDGADVAGNDARERAEQKDKQDGFDSVHVTFSTDMC